MADGAADHRRAVTRADVAPHAQVSSAVVSYVVNGGPKKVAPATAARVREAIELLGYRPNMSARALKRGTIQMLGLVIPDIANLFFAEYVHEIQLAAVREGYALVIAASGGDKTTEARLVNDLAARGLDGLLISTVLSRWDVAALRHPGLPTVLFDCQYEAPGYATIGPAAQQGARLAVEHLIQVHGHRSVALIMGEMTEEEIPSNRERGWLDASDPFPTNDADRLSGLLADGFAAVGPLNPEYIQIGRRGRTLGSPYLRWQRFGKRHGCIGCRRLAQWSRVV